MTVVNACRTFLKSTVKALWERVGSNTASSYIFSLKVIEFFQRLCQVCNNALHHNKWKTFPVIATSLLKFGLNN